MSLASDFIIDTDNKILRHQSGTDIYTVNDLYSYLQDYFDEIAMMTVQVPMSAQTPTEYTLINGWFMDQNSLKYLRNGAIKTVGWDANSFSDGIDVLSLSATGYVGCVSSDIGLPVNDGTHTATLVDYDNTLRKWYVRRNTSAVSGAVAIIGGTGSGTVLSGQTGESLFANVYTLGALNPLTTNVLYVEQVNPELVNNQITQYWNSGHVDLIVKVKEANTLINNGKIRVFCREFGDLYSHFAIDLSSGGRNPVPLGTSSDSNNQSLLPTVSSWNDVTITFGTFSRNIGNGNGARTYDVEIDCGNRVSLLQVYERLKLITSRNSGFTINTYPGQFYRSANDLYNENTQAPFGTFAGGQFFGARGVYLKNVPAVDVNNYQLVDSTGTTQIPPYLAGGTLVFNDYLANDGALAKYALFYRQINTGTSCALGTDNAVVVKKADGITEITGTLAGNLTTVSFDYDFFGNMQCAWIKNNNYVSGDYFRYGTTWYKVNVNYTSDATFGTTDTMNCSVVTGPAVVLMAIGLSNAQYVQVSGFITQSTTNRLAATSAPERSYVN